MNDSARSQSGNSWSNIGSFRVNKDGGGGRNGVWGRHEMIPRDRDRRISEKGFLETDNRRNIGREEMAKFVLVRPTTMNVTVTERHCKMVSR